VEACASARLRRGGDQRYPSFCLMPACGTGQVSLAWRSIAVRTVVMLHQSCDWLPHDTSQRSC
jgi:hypothetical protein